MERIVPQYFTIAILLECLPLDQLEPGVSVKSILEIMYRNSFFSLIIKSIDQITNLELYQEIFEKSSELYGIEPYAMIITMLQDLNFWIWSCKDSICFLRDTLKKNFKNLMDPHIEINQQSVLDNIRGFTKKRFEQMDNKEKNILKGYFVLYKIGILNQHKTIYNEAYNENVENAFKIKLKKVDIPQDNLFNSATIYYKILSNNYLFMFYPKTKGQQPIDPHNDASIIQAHPSIAPNMSLFAYGSHSIIMPPKTAPVYNTLPVNLPKIADTGKIIYCDGSILTMPFHKTFPMHMETPDIVISAIMLKLKYYPKLRVMCPIKGCNHEISSNVVHSVDPSYNF